MKKKSLVLKGLCISLMAAALLAGTYLYLAPVEKNVPMAGGLVEATSYDQSSIQNTEVSDFTAQNASVSSVPDVSGSFQAPTGNTNNNNIFEEKPTAEEESVSQAEAVTPAASSAPEIVTSEVVEVASAVSEPAEAPAVQAQSTTTAPVSYSFGVSKSYTFRMEVVVTNNGSDTSRNVNVSVPLLENRSPYQTTTLKTVNYEIVSSSGRVSTFNIGDLVPGESKTITADFDITVRTVSLNSSNATVELARQAYEKHKGSGNCRDLALAFIKESESLGITAREVIGFARPQRGEMISGSLQGFRHSWAEFYVEELGWVPVDLTFHYFGTFPQTSHVVESYGDQSLRVNYTGGSLSASWSNMIL